MRQAPTLCRPVGVLSESRSCQTVMLVSRCPKRTRSRTVVRQRQGQEVMARWPCVGHPKRSQKPNSAASVEAQTQQGRAPAMRGRGLGALSFVRLPSRWPRSSPFRDVFPSAFEAWLPAFVWHQGALGGSGQWRRKPLRATAAWQAEAKESLLEAVRRFQDELGDSDLSVDFGVKGRKRHEKTIVSMQNRPPKGSRSLYSGGRGRVEPHGSRAFEPLKQRRLCARQPESGRSGRGGGEAGEAVRCAHRATEGAPRLQFLC